jgi:hypothetical protein
MMMRFLLSCPHSEYSLIGYDYDSGEVFWKLKYPISFFGICYGQNNELFATGRNRILKFMPEGYKRARLNQFKANTRPHSVKMMKNGNMGVVDTGNSAIRVYNENLELLERHEALLGYNRIFDCIHINDFTESPIGLLATCFGYNPYREVIDYMGRKGVWTKNRTGLVINLSEFHGTVVFSGLSCPHSLNYYNGKLYVLSSYNQTLYCLDISGPDTLIDYKLTLDCDKFIRGLCFADEDDYYIGGTYLRYRRDDADTAAEFYRISGREIESKTIPEITDIYEVIPWREDIMRPIIEGPLKL